MNTRRNVVPLVFAVARLSDADARARADRRPRGVQHTAVVPLVTKPANPDVVNAWGLAFNGARPAWIADNGTGKSSVYDANNALLLTVTVPGAAGSPQSKPTGVVFDANPASVQRGCFHLRERRRLDLRMAGGQRPDRRASSSTVWALEFPGNAGGFDPRQLSYTAGPSYETGGVYGRINLL